LRGYIKVEGKLPFLISKKKYLIWKILKLSSP
jgi:hypothetical protein